MLQYSNLTIGRFSGIWHTKASLRSKFRLPIFHWKCWSDLLPTFNWGDYEVDWYGCGRKGYMNVYVVICLAVFPTASRGAAAWQMLQPEETWVRLRCLEVMLGIQTTQEKWGEICAFRNYCWNLSNKSHSFPAFSWHKLTEMEWSDDFATALVWKEAWEPLLCGSLPY